LSPLPTPADPLAAARAPHPLGAWAEKYVSFMDDAVRIPGTRAGVGLDPILGMIVPGVGDALTGAGSIALLVLALREGVPTVKIVRMVMNIGIDTAFGALPVVGDAFDLFFRSNRRNLEIIQAHRGGGKPGTADYVVVTFGILLAILSVAIPILVFWGLGAGAIVALWKLLSS
jgi:hypothetical protein